jgi:heme/copper-type cytochrome/quinol oxidase subunit 2
MEQDTAQDINAELKPVAPSVPPKPEPTFKSKPKFLRWILVIAAILVLVVTIGSVIYLLVKNSASKNQTDSSRPIKRLSPTPTPNPMPLTKTYVNYNYAFQIIYPANGDIQTANGIIKGECGNAISEIITPYAKDTVTIDNFLQIVVVDWSRPINEYLVRQKANSFYTTSPIASTSADEAVSLKLNDNWRSQTTSLTPPLASTINIYKKGDNLFLLNTLAENNNINGCIPKNVDFVKNYWGNDNFQFIELPDQTNNIANWNTYTFPIEKLIVRYPKIWTLKTQVLKGNSTTETINLTSPNDFQLNIGTGGQVSANLCEADCQSHNLTNSVLDTFTFLGKQLYVVVHGLKDDSSFGSARTLFSVITSKSCFDNLCGGFSGQRNLTITIQGGFINTQGGSTVYTYTPVDEFINSPDVTTALLILKNLRY